MLIAYKDGVKQSKFERIGRNPCQFRETVLLPGTSFGITSDHHGEVSHYLGKTLLQAFRQIEKTCRITIKKVRSLDHGN